MFRMQKDLNLKIKYRGFRPFAPIVLEEHAKEWSEIEVLADKTKFLHLK